MLQVREFRDAGELRAHYAAVARRIFDRPSVPPKVNEVLYPPPPPAPLTAAAAKALEIDEQLALLQRRRDAANRLIAKCRRKEAQADEAMTAAAERWRLAELLELVALLSGQSVLDLQSERRDNETVRPRQVFCWIAKRFTVATLGRIGRAIGGRDHTSVLHGVRRVALVERVLPEPPEENTPVAWTKALLSVHPWPAPLCRRGYAARPPSHQAGAPA